MREILAASLVITLLSSAVLAETTTSDRDVFKGLGHSAVGRRTNRALGGY